MRAARASLRDRKQVDNQGFKFRARVGVGPDESGLPGYVGGPALDAGRSCVTPGRHAGGDHSYNGQSQRAGGPDKSGAQRYVGGPALDAGRSCVTLGAMGRRTRIRRRARGSAGRSCVTPGR